MNSENGKGAIASNDDAQKGMTINPSIGERAYRNKLKRLRRRAEAHGLMLLSAKLEMNDRCYWLVSVDQAVNIDELAIKWGAADLSEYLARRERSRLLDAVTKGSDNEAISAVLRVRAKGMRPALEREVVG